MTPILELRRLTEVVCDIFCIRPSELRSACRHKHLVDARRLFVYYARSNLNVSYPELGRFLGGRHHTTIMSQMRRAEVLYREHVEFVRSYLAIEAGMRVAAEAVPARRIVH